MRNKHGIDSNDAILFWQIQEAILCDLSAPVESELMKASESVGLDAPLQSIWGKLSHATQSEIETAWAKDYEE